MAKQVQSKRCMCSRVIIITPTGKQKKGKKVICQYCNRTLERSKKDE